MRQSIFAVSFVRTRAFWGWIPKKRLPRSTGRSRYPAEPAGLTSSAALERDPGARPRGSLVLWIAGTVAALLIAFVVYNELTLRRPEVAANAASPPPTSPVASTSSLPPSLATPARPSPAIEYGARSLALVLSAPSWLRVTVDGSVSIEGTFPAGTSKTFHGKNALVRIGNAGGVEIYVDGKDVGKLGKPGDVVEQSFTL